MKGTPAGRPAYDDALGAKAAVDVAEILEAGRSKRSAAAPRTDE
ncbi:hypothetical protein ACFSL4_28465 [Streptomyces caeni]|uniref:Uncharacterized protein n=1 Tax=Streptomyces caeni TaxID=2307231 RepID=A0ABW4IZE3_9ACTN